MLETARTRLLVDAGLGKKETLKRLADLRLHVQSLDGILISHEHNDHSGGVAQLARHWRAPVFLTEPTLHEVRLNLSEAGARKLDRVEYIRPGMRFTVGDIEVHPFHIPHDAAEPVGFTFRANGCKVALVTDLGCLPQHVRYHLRDSDCLILESNHDLDMLKVGPYPWYVKQRVMSRTGHLSNHALGEFLADAEGFDARARYVVLAHLSQQNNHPEIARLSAEEALRQRPPKAAFGGELLIASQHTPLGPLELL